MENKKSIKTYLPVIIALAVGLIFGFSFGISDKKDDFVSLNRNLENSIKQIELKNKYICAKLDEMHQFNPCKVDPWRHYAQKVRQKTEVLCNYIQQIKNNKSKNEITNLQNELNIHTNFLLSSLGNKESKDRILSYDNVKELSEMSPRAFVAALSKIQVDIKNNETEILQCLTNMVDENDYRVNEMRAITFPESRVIRLGETYRALITLAARDTTSLPEVRVNGELVRRDGWYSVKPTSTGTFTYRGTLTICPSIGEIRQYPFEDSYVVRP